MKHNISVIINRTQIFEFCIPLSSHQPISFCLTYGTWWSISSGTCVARFSCLTCLFHISGLLSADTSCSWSPQRLLTSFPFHFLFRLFIISFSWNILFSMLLFFFTPFLGLFISRPRSWSRFLFFMNWGRMWSFFWFWFWSFFLFLTLLFFLNWLEHSSWRLRRRRMWRRSMYHFLFLLKCKSTCGFLHWSCRLMYSFLLLYIFLYMLPDQL